MFNLLQKSEHSYFLRFTEQGRAVVKEDIKEGEFVFIQDPSPLLSTNHVNAELYRALRIVTKFVCRTASACLRRHHTTHTAPPTTFSDKA